MRALSRPLASCRLTHRGCSSQHPRRPALLRLLLGADGPQSPFFARDPPPRARPARPASLALLIGNLPTTLKEPPRQEACHGSSRLIGERAGAAGPAVAGRARPPLCAERRRCGAAALSSACSPAAPTVPTQCGSVTHTGVFWAGRSARVLPDVHRRVRRADPGRRTAIRGRGGVEAARPSAPVKSRPAIPHTNAGRSFLRPCAWTIRAVVLIMRGSWASATGRRYAPQFIQMER